MSDDRMVQDDVERRRRPLLKASLNLRLRAYSGGPWFSARRTAMHVLIVALLLSMSRSAGVAVDEVVLHAAIAERAHPAKAGDRVRLRFSPHGIGNGAPFSLVREVGSIGAIRSSGQTSGAQGASGDKGGPRGVPGAVSQALTRALASAGFDAAQPLSVQPLVAFRALHAPGKTERAVSLPKEGVLVVTSAASGTVSEGELREVELTVDAETYDVVREALDFANIGRLEIEGIGPPHRAAKAANGPNATNAANYVPPRKPAVAPIAAPPSRDELDLADLKRRLTLAETGADMHGGIRVSRTPDIRTLALLGWRARTFGEDRTRRSFLPDLTRSLAAVRQRLEILTDLSKHYPAPRSHMSAATRAAFQQLVDLQYRRLRAELNDLTGKVLTLSGRSVNVALDTESTPPDLVAHAASALSRARAVEQLVHDAFRQDDLTPDDEQRINAAFSALWEAVYGPAPSRP